MTDKLKPCPFCGGEARINNYGFNQYSVGCSECWVETNRVAGVESAVKRWNTRKPMDMIVEQLVQHAENGSTRKGSVTRVSAFVQLNDAIAIVKGVQNE